MGFLEDNIFPDDISAGSRGGPTFAVSVVETDSGKRERVLRHSQSQRRYDVAYGVRSQEQLYAIIEHFEVSQGRTQGFRFKDWADYSTTGSGTTHLDTDDAVTATDVVLGTGDASTTTFQLIKKYTRGATTRNRTIEKPVSGSVLVALDGVPQSSGFSVNTTTGVVTFTTAPANNVEVTAGFEFDVPVMYDTDLEGMTLTFYGGGDIPSIPLIELVNETQVQDEFYYGDAKNFGAITADQAITLLDGRVLVFEQSTSSLEIILPVKTTVPVGAPLWYLINDGSTSLDVTDEDLNTVITLGVGDIAVILLGIDSGGNRFWYAK